MAPKQKTPRAPHPADTPQPPPETTPPWMNELLAAAESRLEADLQKPYRALLDEAAARRSVSPLPETSIPETPPYLAYLAERQQHLSSWFRVVDSLAAIARQLAQGKAPRRRAHGKKRRLANRNTRNYTRRPEAEAVEPLIVEAYRQIDAEDWSGADTTILRVLVRLQSILLDSKLQGRAPRAWRSVVRDLVAQHPEDTPAKIVNLLAALAEADHHLIERYARLNRSGCVPPLLGTHRCPRGYHFHLAAPSGNGFNTVTVDRIKRTIRALHRKSASC